MKKQFFEATLLRPGGYGRNGREMIVAPARTAPEKIAQLLSDPLTDVVSLADADSSGADDIFDELAPILDDIGGEKLVLNFKNSAEFKKAFENEFKKALKKFISFRVPSFPLFEKDVLSNLGKLKHVFSPDAPIAFGLYYSQSEKIEKHTDFKDDRNRKRAVRPISELGTIHILKDRPGYFHTGANFSIIKGDAVHSVHPSHDMRAIYAFEGVELG